MRGLGQLEQFGNKVREARLRGFGRVQRKDSGDVGQKMLKVG